MKTAKDLKGQQANLKSLPNFVKVNFDRQDAWVDGEYEDMNAE
jgi:hypothetical protein